MSTTPVTPASHMDRTDQTSAATTPCEAPFTLVTLGAVGLVRPDGALVLGPSKPLALLAYLHVAPRRTATREHLANLLWGDSDPRHAAGSLRTTLSRMRAELPPSSPDPSTSEVALRSPIVSDRDEFQTAIDGGQLELAVSLYKGPFFPEYSDTGTAEFEHWVELERARLQEYFVRASETLVRRALNNAQWRQAAALARRARSMVPHSEVGWRLVLESLHAANDELGLRAEAEAFRAWLDSEGREPEKTTARLLAEIEAGEGPSLSAEGSGQPVFELVGREKEFSAVLQAWETAHRGVPQLVHIEAPSGLGKTRLLTEVGRRLRALGAQVVSVRANPGEQSVDFALAADLARALASAPGATGVSSGSIPFLIGLQPSLTSLFSSGSSISHGTDLLLQRAQALGELVGAVSDNRPLAILIDDVHWLDPQSRQVVVSIAERLERHKVLLLTAGRPHEDKPLAKARLLLLPQLSLADVKSLLVNAGTVPSDEWAQILAEALHRSTRGSPLLMLESLQWARDSGELVLEDGHWTSPDSAALIRRLARTDAMETRLRGLAAPERSMLALLACAGTPLRADQISVVINDSGGEVQVRLRELERSGYVGRVGAGWEVAHDEMGATMLRLASDQERLNAHAALGRLDAVGPAVPASLVRAARHCIAAGDETRLGLLLRQWIILERQSGRHSSWKTLAKDMIGETPDTELIRRLGHRLPLRLRFPKALRGLTAAAAVVAVAIAIIAWRRSQPPAVAPDAMLLATSDDPTTNSVRMYQLPVFADHWNAADSLDQTGSTRGEQWKDVSGILDWIGLQPGGKQAAYGRITGDSGVIDLILRRPDGSTQRLTETVGDDIDPSWSPDGKYLAFRTSRWTPRGNEDSDLGIMDIATGAVRQLTRGPDSDQRPAWSPDGTRIAFTRTREDNGTSELCWVSFDGTTARCLSRIASTLKLVSGWRDDDRVILGIGPSDDSVKLAEVSLSSGQARVIDSLLYIDARVSPDGRWILEFTGEGVSVFPIDRPYLRRPAAFGLLGGHWTATWFPLSGDQTPLERLHLPDSSAAAVGISHTLRVTGRDALGRPRLFPAEVLRWRSGDPTIAQVDSESGAISPRKTGKVEIYVTAGGWRSDSTELQVVPLGFRSVFREDWREGVGSWREFGSPKPLTISGPGGVAAFSVNGDNSFASGAVSVAGFRSRAGVGFEALLSTPVLRPKWQRLAVELIADARIVMDGISGSSVCGTALPPAEGLSRMKTMSLAAAQELQTIPTTERIRSGSWYRFRVQIFPDGSCGFALDGRPIWRSPPNMDLDKTFSLAIFGQSVGTKMLAGPLEVWEGIKPGVDWSSKLAWVNRVGDLTRR